MTYIKTDKYNLMTLLSLDNLSTDSSLLPPKKTQNGTGKKEKTTKNIPFSLLCKHTVTWFEFNQTKLAMSKYEFYCFSSLFQFCCDLEN